VRLRRRTSARGIRQRDDRDTLQVRRRGERWVRRRERLAESGGSCEGDAVRHRQGAPFSIGTPGVEFAGRDADVGANDLDLEATAFEQHQSVHRVGVRPVIDPRHHVNDFGEVESAYPRRPRWLPQLVFDVSCRRLVKEERDNRLGIEDGQRGAPARLPASASSSRVRRRT
jgi:hypothetical protein